MFLYNYFFEEEEKEDDPVKDRQKRLKYLCCKAIDSGSIPTLKSQLGQELLFEKIQKKNKRRKNKIIPL